jgi:murein L,D-transpeptidase YcbB/YkuD
MYRHDGYHLIWKDTAITSFSAALEGLEADGLTPGDYRFAEIDPLFDASKRDRLTPDKRVEADILLTEAFLRAVYHLFFGKADPERIDADINFARTYADEDAMPVLLEYIHRGKIDAAFDWARPKSKYYQWLKVGLDRYRSYHTAGGWNAIPAGDVLKPGVTDPRAAMLRKRLAVTADFPVDGAESNDTAVFDPQLEAAVKRFQTRHGLDVDGIVGPETLNAMNVPVSERIEQIRVNLERGAGVSMKPMKNISWPTSRGFMFSGRWVKKSFGWSRFRSARRIPKPRCSKGRSAIWISTPPGPSLPAS